MKNFFKGIVVGLGGVAPGLSGSVLLVIFGLYQKTIDAIGTLFKNFKKNFLFLFPLFFGVGIGVLLFGTIADFFIETFEMQTRYLFLGLVSGTVPFLYRQVKEKGFSRKYYIHMILAAVLGFSFFALTKGLFPRVTDPNLIQSLMMGVIYGLAFIVPGLDSAATLSSFGLYEAWLAALADLNFGVLIPAAVGLATGALVISFFMSKLLKRFYTATFSVIFGLFLTIMPRMLNESCVPSLNGKTVLSFALAVLGFAVSFYFGDIQKHNAWICEKFGKKNIEE